MGVNISGKGVLSGLASLVVGVVNNLNLLVTRIIGYTNVPGTGGSSYYTTTVTTESSVPLYMTVSNSDYLFAYSTDFVEWTEGPLPNPGSFGQYNSIVYAEDKFLALSGNAKIAYSTSTNPTSWTLISLPQTGIAWTNIAYGNGIFVALSTFLGGAAYSQDGITWTLTTLPSSQTDWSDITYGDGKFVAVSGSINFGQEPSNKSIYSTDGINWTETTLPASKYWSSIEYGNGKFVTTSFDLIAYSTNAIDWTSATTSGVGGNTGIAYGSGKFIAANVSYSPEQNANILDVYQSTDGDIWTSLSLTPYTYISSISYVNDRFIANMGQYMGQMSQIYSTDGITWTHFSLSTSNSSWIEGTYGQGTILIETEVQVSIGDSGSGGAEILAPVDVYTVPAGKTTSINEIRIKNNSLNQITYDLGVLSSGVNLSDQNALINDQIVSAGATSTLTNIVGTMSAGQRLVVFPSAVDVVEVKVYGSETNI